MLTRKATTIAAVLASALLVPVAPGHAAITLLDHATFGLDSVIRDLDNGRDFLNLSPTKPYTYPQVVEMLAPGQEFDGWRVASEADMEDLCDAAGIVDGSSNRIVVAKAEQLRDWFREVLTSPTHVYSRGLIVEPAVGQVDSQYAFHISVSRYDPPTADGGIRGYGRHSWSNESTYLVLIAEGVELMADFNNDGVINDLDLTILAMNWGQCGKDHAHGDANGDGCVDDLDLTALAIEWPSGAGSRGDVSAVPEPTTLCLMTLLTLSLPKWPGLTLIRRRRKGPRRPGS